MNVQATSVGALAGGGRGGGARASPAPRPGITWNKYAPGGAQKLTTPGTTGPVIRGISVTGEIPGGALGGRGAADDTGPHRKRYNLLRGDG